MPSTYAHFCFGREVLAALPQEMAAVAGLAVPLVAEVGSGANWGAAH